MNGISTIIIRKAAVNDVETIRLLAHKTWPSAYNKILSQEQLNYMLELIYSVTSLQKQFKEAHNFLLAEENKQPVAFADYSVLKPGIYKLNKIYALPEVQGKGVGKMLLNYVIEEVKKEKATALLLNVNRQNKARQFYEHFGFKIISEENIDIGKGFFMNDYIMSYDC